MKTKKYLIALAIFSSLIITAQAINPPKKHGFGKKIEKKKGKIPSNG